MKDYGRIMKKYEEYWARENTGRPLIHLTAPKSGEIKVEGFSHATLKERWCDVEYVLKRALARVENTYYGCEAYPMEYPDLGPDQFAAMYGIPVQFGENTSWAEHIYEHADTDEIREFILDTENFYYKKLFEMLEAMTEAGKGKYFVGIPDLHPGADALVSMRGPQQLCFDTIESPEFISRGIMELLPGFKEVYEKMYQITTRYQKGSSNWMGVYHPGRWYVTSCDFCCLISPEMFEEFIVEELEEELDFLDASIFHLDGPGALKHLDRLLKIPKLDGVQWVYGAGAPTASHWVPVIEKIQKAGKTVVIEVMPGELEFMLEHVNPQGVLFQVKASSVEEAVELERLAAKYE